MTHSCFLLNFRSADCSTKIFRKCFGLTKFTCSRTKCEAIVSNVLAPHAFDLLKKDLVEAKFICISTDSSNHHSIKMFPVVVRYFLPKTGVKVRVLDFTEEKGEKSEIIFNMLKKIIVDNNLQEKLIAYCGDNAPVNFGNIERSEGENVFTKLKSLKSNIVGIGCAAHIVHNALRNACNALDIEIEATVVQIYTHFYIHTVRTEALKSICDCDDEEYDNLLGYCKSRFLALEKSIGKIIKMYTPLKTYFANIPRLLKVPKNIRDFFNNPYGKLWFIFVHDQVIFILFKFKLLITKICFNFKIFKIFFFKYFLVRLKFLKEL